MTMDFKVRTWLWVVLAVVLAGGLGYTAYVGGWSGEKTNQTSPSPTITTTPSGNTTASPTSPTGTNQGATDGNGQTAASAPTTTSTLPAGWKSFEISLIERGDQTPYRFTVYGKNEWQDATYYQPAYDAYLWVPCEVDEALGCNVNAFREPNHHYVYFNIDLGTASQGDKSFQTPDKRGYIVVKFDGLPLTNEEKNTILNSFQFK